MSLLRFRGRVVEPPLRSQSLFYTSAQQHCGIGGQDDPSESGGHGNDLGAATSGWSAAGGGRDRHLAID